MAQEIFGVLLSAAKLIYEQASIVRKNQRFCRRLSDEVRALEPILRDIDTRWESFAESSKVMMKTSLDLLNGDFQRALDFIALQTKTHIMKKFVIARTTEEEFDEISVRIRDSKSIFMLAMVTKIDQSTSRRKKKKPAPTTDGAPAAAEEESSSEEEEAPPPLPAPPPPPQKTERQLKLDEMQRAYDGHRFEEVINIGKKVLQITKSEKGEAQMVVYLSMACAASNMGNLEQALVYLQVAKENGWDDLQYLECDELKKMKNLAAYRKFKKELKEEVFKRERWRNLPKKVLDQFTKNFEKYDIDASGTIDRTEFKLLLKSISTTKLSDEEIQKIMDDIDADKSGEIGLDEYLNWMTDNRKNIDQYLQDKQTDMKTLRASDVILKEGSASPKDSPKDPLKNSGNINKEPARPETPTMFTKDNDPSNPLLNNTMTNSTNHLAQAQMMGQLPTLYHPLLMQQMQMNPNMTMNPQMMNQMNQMNPMMNPMMMNPNMTMNPQMMNQMNQMNPQMMNQMSPHQAHLSLQQPMNQMNQMQMQMMNQQMQMSPQQAHLSLQQPMQPMQQQQDQRHSQQVQPQQQQQQQQQQQPPPAPPPPKEQATIKTGCCSSGTQKCPECGKRAVVDAHRCWWWCCCLIPGMGICSFCPCIYRSGITRRYCKKCKAEFKVKHTCC